MVKILVALFFSALEGKSNKYLTRQISSQNSNGKTTHFKRKVQVCFAAITRFKKWPRTAQTSGTSWNKRHVTSYAHHGSLSWLGKKTSYFILKGLVHDNAHV